MISKKIKEMKFLLSNQRGVALIMIMTSMIILMAIYGEFTFDSKISRIKAMNILDRSQAKLLAESGLQMAMARLRLYKEAFNKIQSNQTAKAAVSPQLLNQLWEVPFMFPIPVTANASRAFKDTVEKFQDESLLEGEMKVSVQNISSRLNLNLLRMDMAKTATNPNPDEGNNTQLDQTNDALANDVSVDQALFFLLKRLVEEKRMTDETFADRHPDLNYQEMISNLRYYISDYQSLTQDPFAGESEATFQRIPLAPKYGPLSSASELYTIPGWDDELIELIQNEFSVYPTAQIDLNKLTANMLRILIPNMNDDEIKSFFLYRDDPENPKFFNTKQDFKNYIVTQARLMSEEDFDARMKMFEDKGITFSSNPNLFKVVSSGTYNRSIYTLVAYVVLPSTADAAPAPGTPTSPTAPTPPDAPPTDPNAAKQTGQLLEPRIIEIQIN